MIWRFRKSGAPPSPPNKREALITSITEKLDFSHIQLNPRVFEIGDDLPPPPTSRSQINLLVDDRVPIIVANMDSIGTFDVARIVCPMGLMVAILKDYSPDQWKRELEDGSIAPHRVIPTMGLRDIENELDRVKQIVQAFPGVDIICLDVANGYLHSAADAVKRIKDALPTTRLVAGNVVEREGLVHLAQAGADIIKVGIGSGGVCLTRRLTGVGCPQFSAVMDLAPVARDFNVELISDGGMTNPGDAMKAFAAGASFVMSGSYFAGHDETGVYFHGMSSHGSRAKRGQKQEDYRASEGREVVLSPRGPLAHSVQELLGGLNSSCMYLGCRNLGDVRHAKITANRVYQQLNRIEGISSEG